MKKLVQILLRYRPLLLLLLGVCLIAGLYAFRQLDIEAYPDPSPPLVEIITQNPSWSAEEMEQQVTMPLETALNGMPRLSYIRSISIFGLSDIKMYFEFGSDYFYDRQEVLNRLQTVNLPSNLSPQLSPWSPVGEIYRFRVDGPHQSLNELKATSDWLVRREIKQVPGIIDVTTFGGSTRQYQAEIDPRKLLQFNLTLAQVVQAVQNANANTGGGYLSLGNQNVNVRGVGLLKTTADMANVVVAEHNGAPVYLRDVADVREGAQPRLGQVGMDGNRDIVQGIVLLQKGEQSLPALQGLHEKIQQLNHGLLPAGIKLRTIYDRTDLIHLTTATVRHLVITGILLVTVLLLIFLGNVRMSLLTAVTIPFSILFAFALMVLTGQSANLISIGAIDFGILVDAGVIVLEHIYRGLQQRLPEQSVSEVIAEATADAARPVLFSTMVILAAFIPLFTMSGVPGRIFAPMSVTYGFALAGALLFALLIAPVLASFVQPGPAPHEHHHTRHLRFLRGMRRRYDWALEWTLTHSKLVLVCAIIVLLIACGLVPFLGGEFMPKLEEGNIWLRATLPADVSFEYAAQLADSIRADLLTYPEVEHVVSQMGRPDDGTDPTTFNNVEFNVLLKPNHDWRPGLSKDQLIDQMDKLLDKYPGVITNFSQNIQDNVEEAMSGVKGENSLKLFGDDFDVLAQKAEDISKVMAATPGIADLGVLHVDGQPNLLIAIDRAAAARYGLMAADVNNAVQAAIGGIAATQILDNDRRYDMVVRYRSEFRQNPDAIRNILLPTPDGGRVPLGQVASVTLHNGAFTIYRENDRRYIPIKFSVRGRDLSDTMQDVQNRLERQVQMPSGYHYEWAGEYDSLQKELRRLMIVVPICMGLILALLYLSFNSLTDALLVMAVLPFGAIGGMLSLLITRTPFSISAAVGFASALGVGTLGASILLNAIRHAEAHTPTAHDAIRRGALDEMRPVVMACLAAGLGLLPAALSHGIGAQAQQPLARVVVGAMITTTPAILFLLPVFAHYARRYAPKPAAEPPDPAVL
jgi:cobalt-zinc-cadmium resistance protein CzcA